MEGFNVSEAKNAAQRTGLYVFLALLVLTIAESIVGSLETPITVLLLIIALVKAALIVYFFMHVYRLWREESH
jgi:caa(3)-type oxidase subunit IV